MSASARYERLYGLPGAGVKPHLSAEFIDEGIGFGRHGMVTLQQGVAEEIKGQPILARGNELSDVVCIRRRQLRANCGDDIVQLLL